jgi:hypothetical protein
MRSQLLPDPLSKRELEVLRLIAGEALHHVFWGIGFLQFC